MAMKGYSLLLCVFLVQLALGDNSDVYYWRQNSNWNNPSNWELGSPPCGKQIASVSIIIVYCFGSLPLVYVDS